MIDLNSCSWVVDVKDDKQEEDYLPWSPDVLPDDKEGRSPLHEFVAAVLDNLPKPKPRGIYLPTQGEKSMK